MNLKENKLEGIYANLNSQTWVSRRKDKRKKDEKEKVSWHLTRSQVATHT
jgi:hypothetical protein